MIYSVIKHEDINSIRSPYCIHSSYCNMSDAILICKRLALKNDAEYDPLFKVVFKAKSTPDGKDVVLFSIEESCLHDPSEVPHIVL